MALTEKERAGLREQQLAKARTLALPLPPWTHNALGEEKYCELARELGFFNPKSEATDYRPSLDPTLFLDVIREQHKKAAKPSE